MTEPTISYCIERGGNNVFVYDQKNRLLWSKWGQLQGYTSSSVSIKRYTTIHVYNAKGQCIATHSTR